MTAITVMLIRLRAAVEITGIERPVGPQHFWLSLLSRHGDLCKGQDAVELGPDASLLG